MGAWGIGPFDNDEALDFLNELAEDSDAIEMLSDTFDVPPGYINDHVGSRVMAAATLVAASGDGSTEDVPDQHADIFEKLSEKLPAALTSRAHEAVEKILQSSETRDLWEEGDMIDEWEEQVNELLVRLA